MIDILQSTRDEAQIPKNPENAACEKRVALRQESERALVQLIRYRLSLAPEKRLNCLRRKIGLRATCL